MKKVFTPSLILAGILAAGSAAAETPYSSWTDASSSVDVAIQDSFKSSSVYSEDNDVHNTATSSVSEDNDVSSWYASSEDNDVTTDVRSSVQEDNDYSSVYTNTEDNDYAHSEDNDYTHTEDNDVSTALDFQIATPTMTGYKYQDQDAGHQADQNVLGAARGHEVGVAGGTTVVAAGNDEQTFYGPAMVNNNTNQLPQNNLFVQGSNGAPISQSNTFAGRDMGPKGVFAPIGNTSATVVGDTSQASGAQLGQSGDSGNSIADQMNSGIYK